MGFLEDIGIRFGPYKYVNRNGTVFFLKKKVGIGGTMLYYFTKREKGELLHNPPKGYTVVENLGNGFPTLKKRKQ